MKKLLLFLLCLVLLLPAGCTQSFISETYIYFDTAVTLTAKTDKSVLDGAFSLCEKYENMLSRTIKTSEIARLNFGEKVEVSAETLELINKALYYNSISGGKFDITVAAVTSLYDFKGNVLPQQNDIQNALNFVGSDKIHIENNLVWLSSGTMLDLGGIAKGFVADKIKEYFLSNNVKDALIDLGGNIVTIGKHFKTVEIKTPFKNETFAEIDKSGESFVTSGVDQRFIESDGVLYHHIIDPETGYGVQNGLYQVTVTGQNSADCDALSTTLMLLGETEGIKLLKAIGGYEAVFYKADNSVTCTEGLKNFLVLTK